MRPQARNAFLIAAVLFAGEILLNLPFFLPGEMPFRDSIEGGYVSMARFISVHPNPFGWNPVQYFGLPTHMWYLPAVPYAGALAIHLLPFLEPGHAYRLLVTLMASFVPVAVFLFANYFTRSRVYALAAAVAYTFFSPGYFYFTQLNTDRGLAQIPWRLQVLLKYGEGPHSVGLALLPLALIVAWRTGIRREYRDVLLSAGLFAAVALTNWVAALSLAWCCLMMLLAGAGSAAHTGFLARRPLAAAALAYLLACFWLTPGFIATTFFNWPQDAFGYEMQRSTLLLLGVLAFVPVLIRIAFLKAPRHLYLCYLLLCSFGFGFIVCSHYWYGIDVIPESRRYEPEAEMFVVLLLVELLRQAMKSSRLVRGLALGLAMFIVYEGRSQLAGYPFRAWQVLRPAPREQVIEYKVSKALDSFSPSGRVLVSGGTRFRLNSWFLIPQVGGTFESGLSNRTPVDLIYSLKTGVGIPPQDRATTAVEQLRIAGVEYVAFHGPHSREHYHDYVNSGLPFESMFERVWHDEDDSIYRVPFNGFAHLVKPEEIVLGAPTAARYRHAQAYVSALDDPSRPRLGDAWTGPDRMTIQGPIPDGMAVSVQVSYDGGWRASQDGSPISVEKDPIGFLLLHPRPSQSSTVELRYTGSLEQKIFTALSALVWLAALAALRRR